MSVAPPARRVRARILVALVLLALSALPGCEPRDFTVRIADFDAGSVSGLHLYRLDEASAEWRLEGWLVFEGVEVGPEGERILARQAGPEGVFGFTHELPVTRDPVDPGAVRVAVRWLRDGEPGWFRVSAYNEVGESELSEERILL